MVSPTHQALIRVLRLITYTPYAFRGIRELMSVKPYQPLIPLSKLFTTLVTVGKYGLPDELKRGVVKVPIMSWEYVEVFALRTYEDAGNLVKDRVFIDVGSGWGSSALWAWLKGASFIIAVDADPDAYEATKFVMNLNNIMGVALREDATKIDWASLVKQMGLDSMEFIAKIDCEGCEAVVAPMLAEAIKPTALIIEIHKWVDRNKLLRQLSDRGYKCRRVKAPVDEYLDGEAEIHMCTRA